MTDLHSQIDAKALAIALVAADEAYQAEEHEGLAFDSAVTAGISAYLSTLHGQQSEAVAWQWRSANSRHWVDAISEEAAQWALNAYGGGEIRHLYTHPLPTEVAPVAVSVKPLEWQEPSSRSNGCWTAECILGTFSVAFDDGWHAELEDGLRWEWEPDQDPRSYHGPWPAQKACHDFLEAKLRSAIIPAAKLAGAVEALRAMLDHYGPPTSVADLCEYPAKHPISLARAAITAQAGDGVPGMVLVPRECTLEMEQAFFDENAKATEIFADVSDLWRAMLSASTAGGGK